MGDVLNEGPSALKPDAMNTANQSHASATPAARPADTCAFMLMRCGFCLSIAFVPAKTLRDAQQAAPLQRAVARAAE